MIDWSINAGHVITLMIFLVGGLGVAFAMRGDLRHVQSQLVSMQNELEKIGQLLTASAVQTTRLNSHDDELRRLWAIIDDLRRGEGMILPLMKGRSPP